jgi:hypothetical protein
VGSNGFGAADESAVVVEIEDLVQARLIERRATAVASRTMTIALGVALVGMIGVWAAADAVRMPLALVAVFAIVALACVVCVLAVRRRRPSVTRWNGVVTETAGRVVDAAARAGLPEPDRTAVLRALREDDNGPAPWFDPKLGPREWPFWDLTPQAPSSATVFAEKSAADRRLTLRRMRRPDER